MKEKLKFKPYVICIVGESGSGKTTLSRIFDELGVKAICSYTTRRMRDGEVNNLDHIFVSQDEFNELKLNYEDPMVAYTNYGGFEYCTTLSQFKAHEGCCYVVDEPGVNYMHKHFSDVLNIVPIYVFAGDKVLERGVTEERIARDRTRNKSLDVGIKYTIGNFGSIDDLKNNAKITLELINTSMFA